MPGQAAEDSARAHGRQRAANSGYIYAHHIEHWANGGETKPSNLVSLCRFHHRAVHEGGIRIDTHGRETLVSEELRPADPASREAV